VSILYVICRNISLREPSAACQWRVGLFEKQKAQLRQNKLRWANPRLSQERPDPKNQIRRRF
jgi:hypothetical protein